MAPRRQMATSITVLAIKSVCRHFKMLFRLAIIGDTLWCQTIMSSSEKQADLAMCVCPSVGATNWRSSQPIFMKWNVFPWKSVILVNVGRLKDDVFLEKVVSRTIRDRKFLLMGNCIDNLKADNISEHRKGQRSLSPNSGRILEMKMVI